jgi:hypothetical protein
MAGKVVEVGDRIVDGDEALEGTVNLPNGGRAKTGGFPLALRGDAQFGDLARRDHRFGTKRAIVR